MRTAKLSYAGSTAFLYPPTMKEFSSQVTQIVALAVYIDYLRPG